MSTTGILRCDPTKNMHIWTAYGDATCQCGQQTHYGATPAPLLASDSSVLDVTPPDLVAIARRAETSRTGMRSGLIAILVDRDIPALIEEVERLRALHASTSLPLDGTDPIAESAYCHHRHHLDEHSRDFDTCPHVICANARRHASTEGARRDSEILRRSNIVEIAVHNDTGSVSDYMQHWEGRALKAEAQLQATEGALRQVVERLLERIEGGHKQSIGSIDNVRMVQFGVDEIARYRSELSALLALPLGGERKT